MIQYVAQIWRWASVGRPWGKGWASLHRDIEDNELCENDVATTAMGGPGKTPTGAPCTSVVQWRSMLPSAFRDCQPPELSARWIATANQPSPSRPSDRKTPLVPTPTNAESSCVPPTAPSSRSRARSAPRVAGRLASKSGTNGLIPRAPDRICSAQTDTRSLRLANYTPIVNVEPWLAQCRPNHIEVEESSFFDV